MSTTSHKNTIEWLQTLIGFDTTSRNSNLELIATIHDYCISLGLQPHMTFNPEKTKANLFVSIPDISGNLNGGLILSGHTDVVPVTSQNWDTDPFIATIIDDKLYGRGSCDMKGFIASVLNLLPQAIQTPLKKPIHMALSFDEEVGCLGVPFLLEDLNARGIQPDDCIVGEPTNMKMIVAHKGINMIRCHVTGHSCHSSLTNHGVNAIEYAARLIIFITELAEQFKLRSDIDPAYDVPYSTLSTNLIQGGTATNIVPNSCELMFDYRNLPHMDLNDVIVPIESFIAEHLRPKMQAIHPDSDIELQVCEQVLALNDREQSALYDLIEGLIGQTKRQKAAFTTEGGAFDAQGVNTVLCGPGSINQAHQANEYIELSQLAQCDDFLRQILQKYQQI